MVREEEGREISGLNGKLGIGTLGALDCDNMMFDEDVMTGLVV